jgi:cytochrome P450
MTTIPSEAPGCPVRKLEPEGRSTGPALEQVSTAGGGRWLVRSFDVARQVLRDPEGTVQAGFGAEGLRAGAAGDGASEPRPRRRRRGRAMRPPILYLEGAQHRTQRKAAARFFAPKVTEGYREMMEAFSDDLVRQVGTAKPVDLSRLSMQMAVQVAAQVVGLTNSSTRGMSRRLDTFFARDPLASRPGPAGWLKLLRCGTATARFFWLDVKPAIRARRRRPREDVVSQLLAEGFSDLEVLTECLTYGAAGMVTTREFICVAAWHLLDDPALLAQYRDGNREERSALLQEALRLEPVVGHLYRRIRQPLAVTVDGVQQVLPAGALVDLDLRAANADGATVGAEPYGLCPGRELPRSVPPALMSFGDGNHRCPGAPIAIMESEIFLSALFRHDLVALGPPSVSWNPVSQGYDLDDFLVIRRPG